MQLVILTGMSGAGKALAAKTFEDMAFTVVDNLPPVLLPELVEKCQGVGSSRPRAVWPSSSMHAQGHSSRVSNRPCG